MKTGDEGDHLRFEIAFLFKLDSYVLLLIGWTASLDPLSSVPCPIPSSLLVAFTLINFYNNFLCHLLPPAFLRVPHSLL